VKITPTIVENLAGATGCILGTAAQSDPFHVRTINGENIVEEVDRSDELLETIKKEKIDAVISVVGSRALSILWKLSRKGLKTVCVPKSVENDVAATVLSFGFNSALSFVAEMLERCRQAAQSARRIGVVEVLVNTRDGWRCKQEWPYAPMPCSSRDSLRSSQGRGESAGEGEGGRTFGLVVVAEGAKPLAGLDAPSRTSTQK